MSTEQIEAVAIRPVSGNSLQEVMKLGQVFKASGYFRDIRDEAQAVTKILYGRELGFTPIVSIMGIHIIDGKPSLSANLLATTVKRSGRYDYRVKVSDATKCVLLFREKNEGKWEDIGESEFSMEDAKAAGVGGKDNWRKYPKAMLFARALSQGVRQHCPDVSACPVYVPEELGASVTEEGEVAELPAPKTIKVVERTTEDIEIGPKTNNSAKPLEKDGTQGPEPYRVAADLITAVAAANEKPPRDGHPAPREVAAIAPPPAPDIEYVSTGQAANFYRTFREACPMGVDSDTLAHDWLFKGGYVDDDGRPTALRIPKSQFEQVKAMAKTFAKGLK